MFVGLNLLVICVVLLNFGDCNNCDGVLKCDTNDVGDAISANFNVILHNIKDTSENLSILDKTQDNSDNLLNNLTRFLVEKISGLIIENPSIKKLGNNTQIYIHTFKINESAYENKPIINTIKTDLNNNDTHFLNNTHNIVLQEDNKIISNNYNESVRNEPLIEKTGTNTTTATILKKTNNTDINRALKTNKTNFEHTTYSVNYINKQATVTRLEIPGKNDNIEVTIENLTEIPGVTVKVSEKNIIDINAKNGINNIQPQISTHKINMISETVNVKDNYVDDTNDLFHDINEIDVDEPVHDNLTDYLDIDYVDMYKDTTNEDVEYTPAVFIPTTTVATKVMIDKKPADNIDSVYLWIATVFIMNRDNKQFEYICDGILLSERVVLTAARCVIKENVTVNEDNILFIIGKRSLQSTRANEKVLRVKSIKIHDNFVSNGETVDNDLAIAVLADPVVFNVDIQPAPLALDDKSAPLATATTGWHASGPLQPLYLGLQSTEKSRKDINCTKLFCATLGDSETTCPSYGGLFVERQDDDLWRLKGIASGSPTNTGVCFNKHLTFTKIENYLDWIKEHVHKTSSN